MATTETERNLADLCAIVDAAMAGGDIPADRLDALARRYLASSREGRGRIAPQVLADLLRSELTGRFLHQGRRPDETQAGRLLSAALRRARVDIDDRSHFVPCRLFAGSLTVALSVGPVVFRRMATFRDSHAADIAADPEFAALAESDYAPWPWVAEVTVRGCDRRMSRERALRAVDGALDMLRLFAEPEAARALGRAGSPGPPAFTPAGLWSDSTGRLHVERATVLSLLSAGWLRRAHSPTGRDWLERAGRSLSPLVDPSLTWPLADRFREAASWHGEGVGESYEAARILAYVAAIERAVAPGDHMDVWRAVTRRGAILACRAAGGELAEWLDRAAAVYEIRSQIVHGGMSPFDPQAGAMEPRAAAFARAVLRGALTFYEELGLTRSRYSAQRLEQDFRALEAES